MALSLPAKNTTPKNPYQAAVQSRSPVAQTTSKTSTPSTPSSNSVTVTTSKPTSSVTTSSPSGGGSLSGGSTSTVTVQPTYISGGKGGSTYLITDSNGKQNQIAASGISMSDMAKYYAERGDTTNAGKFSAAANYETETGILNTYGTSTGKTYDATSSLVLNSSGTGVELSDTARTYTAGNGLLGSTDTATLGALTVTTSLGITAEDLKNAGGNTEIKATGGGDSSPIQLIGRLSDDNPLTQLLGGRTANSISSQNPADLGGFMQTGSDLVNGFAHLPETLASDGSIGGFLASMAATMVLPTDAVKVGKNFSDGHPEKNTFWDYLYAAADVLSFIPVVGIGVKAVKVGLKSLKLGGVVGLNGVGVAGELTTGTDGDNDAPAQNTNLIGNVAPYAAPEIDFANTEFKIGDVIKKNNSANTPTQNPTEQKTSEVLAPEESAEYDYSGLADLYSLVAQQAGGSGGGSGTTVITNEAQPVDYTGVFRYIIPVAAIIGVVIIIAALSKNSKRRGTSA